MTRSDYLAQLERYLKKLPQADYMEAMEYFTEYFEEVGPDGEKEAMAELGSPKEAAYEVMSHLLDRKLDEPFEHRKRKQMIWIAFLVLIAAPIGLPLVLFLAGLIVFLLAVFLTLVIFLLAVAFGLGVFSLSIIWDSLVVLDQSWAGFALAVGSGLFGLGIVCLLSLLDVYIIRFGGLAIIKIFQSLLKRVKRGKKYEEMG